MGLPKVRKSLCRQAFAYPDKSVGLMEEQIASIHLGCSGWRNSLASFAKSGGFSGTYKSLQGIPIKTICGEDDRILGIKEINKIKNIGELNLIVLKNCGHLPHVDLPFLSGKIIFDYFVINKFFINNFVELGIKTWLKFICRRIKIQNLKSLLITTQTKK